MTRLPRLGFLWVLLALLLGQNARADTVPSASELTSIVDAIPKTFFVAPPSYPGASDARTCSATGRSRPWITVKALQSNNCLRPGDHIAFLPGIYDYKEVFDEGRINVNPTTVSTHPVTVRRDWRSDERWPVKFKGMFSVTGGGPVTISGIEFERHDPLVEHPAWPAFAIGSSNVILKDSYVHGAISDYQNHVTSVDCIQVPGTDRIRKDITIRNNEIAYCTQDAVDIDGAINVDVIGNDIHHALEVQIKGGSFNILIKDNRISNTTYGIIGGGMACSAYCGNVDVPSLPVEERYGAKNVRIVGNTIVDLEKSWAVNFTGWHNVLVKENIIANVNTTFNQEVFSSKNWYTQYFDQAARDYCAAHPSDCQECMASAGADCRRIAMKATQVAVFANHIQLANTNFWKNETGSIDSADLGSICFDLKERQGTYQLDDSGVAYHEWHILGERYRSSDADVITTLPIRVSSCWEVLD